MVAVQGMVQLRAAEKKKEAWGVPLRHHLEGLSRHVRLTGKGRGRIIIGFPGERGASGPGTRKDIRWPELNGRGRVERHPHLRGSWHKEPGFGRGRAKGQKKKKELEMRA